jgi:putative peptidoglycan lipid II flippase
LNNETKDEGPRTKDGEPALSSAKVRSANSSIGPSSFVPGREGSLPTDVERKAPPSPSAGRRLALNAAIVGGAFVLSRVLGLVREAVLAGIFGTSPQYDAYLLAFGVPDTLFLIIIGGAVGSAFIPVFTGLVGKGREEEAWRLTSTLINASLVLLAAGAIAMGLAAPALVAGVIAPGRPPDQQAVVVDLTRILLLSPLFLGLGGWAQGILNARHHFTLPALAPVAYNLAIIAGALLLAPSFGVYGLAWGVVAGALLHFGVQVPSLVKTGMKYSPLRLNLRGEGVGEVGRLLLPRVIGQAAFQFNIVAVRSIATFLPYSGAVSALNYAYLLMMLPHGVFAMSLATVTFPTMAAQYAEGNLEALRATLARATRVILFLTLPSAVGLFALRYEIVTMLFQLGEFTSTSTELVASALGYFAIGLVAYAVVEILTRGFYALHNTATPVAISIATVLINLGLSLLLVRAGGWGHEGLALSLALTTTLEMALMWTLLGRKLPGWGLRSAGMLPSIARSAAAALGMGAAIALLHFVLPVESTSKVEATVVTALGIAIGAAVYLALAKALRSEELDEALGLVLRRFRRRGGS